MFHQKLVLYREDKLLLQYIFHLSLLAIQKHTHKLYLLNIPHVHHNLLEYIR